MENGISTAHTVQTKVKDLAITGLLIALVFIFTKFINIRLPISDIYALRAAVERLLQDQAVLERHAKTAAAVRKSLVDAGLELFPLDSFSSTATTMLLPPGTTFENIYMEMFNEYSIIIAGGFDFLKDKVLRIGHMGENCREEKLYITLKALDQTLRKFNIRLNGKLHEIFLNAM